MHGRHEIPHFPADQQPTDVPAARLQPRVPTTPEGRRGPLLGLRLLPTSQGRDQQARLLPEILRAHHKTSVPQFLLRADPPMGARVLRLRAVGSRARIGADPRVAMSRAQHSTPTPHVGLRVSNLHSRRCQPTELRPAS